MAEQGNQNIYDEDGMNILDYCRVICRRKNLIIPLCFSSVLISLMYSLWLPKQYQSTAKILAPVEVGIGVGSQPAVSMAGQGRGRADALLGALGVSIPSRNPTGNYYKALLMSRTMRTRVLEHIKTKWGPRFISLVGEASLSDFEKESTISLTVEAEDPELAAEVANYYFETLASMLAHRAEDRANLHKQYYQRHLDKARQNLKEAQARLIRN